MKEIVVSNEARHLGGRSSSTGHDNEEKHTHMGSPIINFNVGSFGSIVHTATENRRFCQGDQNQ